MYDPRTLYEDRTPQPLKDAPRDESTRPKITDAPVRSIKKGAFRFEKNFLKIKAKRDGWCVTCQKEFRKGVKILWHKKTLETHHVKCFEQKYPELQSRIGDPSQKIRKQRWRAFMEEKYGKHWRRPVLRRKWAREAAEKTQTPRLRKVGI